jgi:hypothetical protein
MGRRVQCTTCGTDNRAAADDCWFCGDAIRSVAMADRSLALAGGMAGDFSADLVPDRANSRGLLGGELGLAVLALLAVAVCAGAFWIAPGFGFTVTLLVAPALVQTARAVRREAARGRSVSTVAKTGAFVRSLLLGIAARAAGFATFLSITLIGLAAGKVVSQLFGNAAFLVIGVLAVSFGILAGFWVAIRINRQKLSL